MAHRRYILSLEGKSLEETYKRFDDLYNGNITGREGNCDFIGIYSIKNRNYNLHIYDIKNTAVLLDRTENKDDLNYFGNFLIIGLENLIDDAEKDIIVNKFKLDKFKLDEIKH
jgi:hypothetical protein